MLYIVLYIRTSFLVVYFIFIRQITSSKCEWCQVSKPYVECCVPQGSVLGPSRYAKPIGNIICDSDIQFHLFDDDCQPYVSLYPACTTS